MLSEDKWKKKLTPEQYRILREKGTERAFTGEYWDHKEEGHYHCAACESKLFSSNTKFDSETGWPSFTEPFKKEHVQEEEDSSHFMKRIEILCSKCGSHLGHVFNDGPRPTGKRYCINSVALKFTKENKNDDI